MIILLIFSIQKKVIIKKRDFISKISYTIILSNYIMLHYEKQSVRRRPALVYL